MDRLLSYQFIRSIRRFVHCAAVLVGDFVPLVMLIAVVAVAAVWFSISLV